MALLHPHAAGRLEERGATAAEVIETVARGDSFPAKFGRTGFGLDWPGAYVRRGKSFDMRRIEAYCVLENGDWLVITIIVKFWNAP